MEPKYMNEKRYSYMVSFWKQYTNVDYESESPVTEFERRIQSLYVEGQRHLQNEEYILALNEFRELMALILHTANPQLPIDPMLIAQTVFPMDIALLDTLSTKAAEILKNTPTPIYNFPDGVISEKTMLPVAVSEKLKPALSGGLQVISYHAEVLNNLEAAMNGVAENDFNLALRHYKIALGKTPQGDTVLKASLLHDMAIIAEKSNNLNAAQQYAEESVKLFNNTKIPEAQAKALEAQSVILRRAKKEDLAKEATKKSLEIRNRTITGTTATAVTPVTTLRRSVTSVGPAATIAARTAAVLPTAARITPTPTAISTTVESTTPKLTLMGLNFINPSAIIKTLNIQGATSTATIAINAKAATNVKSFVQRISNTNDLQLLTNFWYNHTQMVAYLPHMYFFIIPMSIGDCYAGLGNLAQAEQQYRSVLSYPYINKNFEIVKLWTRLAQTYLDIGDRAYRKAKDKIANYNAAKTSYENLVLVNKTLNPNSPLYRDSKFASIKTRISNFLASATPLAFNDNPAILSLVLEALNKLRQIQTGLNFFGFAINYTPPFSFEYLQNTARYFAQQASQIEQRYIQFKSQAENEELRREQLDQQAEVAAQSVVLETYGLAEAQKGLNIAQTSLNYAQVQHKNAVDAKNEFNAVRWELLQYAELEAWANAQSVSADDEIRLTTAGTGHQYYSVEHRRRSWVIQDLAYARTLISHNLEASKLQRAIDSAAAYTKIAEAQIAQAQVRIDIAEQRIAIAQLQQKNAEENRDFLDMQEFSSRLWYELAQQARRIKQRYLDMATEIAFLMERAYNAETERNLKIIRYDYSQTSANNLMGADQLTADIDYFTYDYVTTTKTKKIPVKQVISIADSYVLAFQQLKKTGRCYFQTELADFDRKHPGMYLCKLRNVEVVFVGLTNATSLAGTLRNIGVSRFRLENGQIAVRLYPSDVMALSQYEIRQDALAFRFNPNDLRLFENNGIETFWQIDLPLDANDFDYKEILDIQLVLYYDGFFSPNLETKIKAALPTNDTASRAFSMKMSFFDELYYLKNKGNAEITFEKSFFPNNQKNLNRKKVQLKVTGKPETVGNLVLRLTSSNFGSEILLTTDANGEVNENTPNQPLNKLNNMSMIDTWKIQITSNDNPSLTNNGVLNLKNLEDILVFFEYSFDYR